VLSANQVLRAAVVSKFLSTGLMIDGQIAIRLHPGDEVVVGKSPFSIRLVAPSSKSYFEVLRAKLNWGRR
jgi:NAD+ kinase